MDIAKQFYIKEIDPMFTIMRCPVCGEREGSYNTIVGVGIDPNEDLMLREEDWECQACGYEWTIRKIYTVLETEEIANSYDQEG